MVSKKEMGVINDKKKYTYEDYLKTPEDVRFELIEGNLIVTPSPVPYHQWVVKNLLYELERFVRKNKVGKVFDAPCDVYLDEENVLQPDILFISNERIDIIGEKKIEGAPELVIEVLSESTAYRDLVKKKKIYAKFGVKEYWIVDPIEKTLDIYFLKENIFELKEKFYSNDIVVSLLLPGLKIKLSEIFEF